VPAVLQVDWSTDGDQWTRAGEWAPGSATLAAALADPQRMPVRLVVPDITARYVLINAGRFRPEAMRVLGR
jgi:hypothetical protein